MAKNPQKSPAAARQAEYVERRTAAGWRRLMFWLAPGVDPEEVHAYLARKNKKALSATPNPDTV